MFIMFSLKKKKTAKIISEYTNEILFWHFGLFQNSLIIHLTRFFSSIKMHIHGERPTHLGGATGRWTSKLNFCKFSLFNSKFAASAHFIIIFFFISGITLISPHNQAPECFWFAPAFPLPHRRWAGGGRAPARTAARTLLSPSLLDAQSGAARSSGVTRNLRFLFCLFP